MTVHLKINGSTNVTAVQGMVQDPYKNLTHNFTYENSIS